MSDGNSLSLQQQSTKGGKASTKPIKPIKPYNPNDSAAQLLVAFEGYCGLSQLTWNLIFAFMVIFGAVGQNVSLPIWFAATPTGELDPYFVLTFAGATFCIFFAIMTWVDICKGKTSLAECREFTNKKFVFQYWTIGVCNALNGIFLVFAAPPSRTPAFLQAVLATFMIGWTLLFRYIILRKVPGKGQSIFAIGVFYGLFIAVIPSIFGLDASDAFTFKATGVWKWLWPVIFGSSFIPAAVMNVVGENVLKDTSQSNLKNKNKRKLSLQMTPNELEVSNVNVWYYLTMQSIAQECTFLLCFWVNAVPSFGTVTNIPDVFKSLKQDWRYFVGLDGASIDCFVRGIVFVTCYIFNYIGSSYLLRYTEGATWTALVSAMVTPLGGIFWLLFELTNDNVFKWSPNWVQSNWYVVAGLFYMTPFIYLYNVETNRLETEAKKKSMLSLLSDVDDDIDHNNDNNTDFQIL